MGEKTPLSKILDRNNYRTLCEKVEKSRKVSDDGSMFFEDISYTYGGKSYRVLPIFMPVEDVKKYSKSSCNKCYGKGYAIHLKEKSKISNPQDYTLMATQPINNMTEEQKKIWIEKEKENKFWRVLLPCSCAVKNAAKKIPDFLFNNEGNILIRLEYEIE